MKKLIKYFVFILLLGTAFILNNNFKVKAESFYEGEYIDNMWMTRDYNGAHWYQKARFFRNSANGKESYCLDPFDLFSENSYYSSSTNYSGFSNDTLNKIKLAAYYGYGYSGHTDKKWYAITQLVIWRYSVPGGNFYFTDGLDGNRISTYDSDINSLINMINNHYKKPSFDNSEHKVIIGNSLTLSDTNGVLSNYNITNGNGLNINKSGNSLVINTDKIGTYNISLAKNSSGNSPTYFYTSSSSQNMMIRGNVDNVVSNLKIKVEGGYININKLDDDTKTCKAQGDASIDGAIYDIYHGSELVDSLTIKDCKAKSKGLPYGDYDIIERTPGIGYQKDDKSYLVTIDDTNSDYVLNLTNKVIKSNIEITKLYGSKEEENYKVEPNIEFGLYDKNDNLISTYVTNKSGYIKFELPYGRYTLKQLNTTENYDKVEDIKVIVDEKSDKKMHFVLKNNLSTTKIKIIKKDKDTNREILDSTALFKIKNITTGKYIYHIVGGEKTNIFRINKDGYLITDVDIEFGTYEIIEILAPNGYKLNKDKIILDINNNSNFYIDENGDKVIEITIYNEKEDLVIDVPDTYSSYSFNIFELLIKTYYEYKKKAYTC